MKFSLNKKPLAKARPRFTRIGNYVRAYTPKATQDYENELKLAFLEQCKGLYDKDYDKAIKVSIWAYFEPTKSVSKKKRLELIGTSYLKKGDADNIAKCVLDALNGIAWKDDSQVCDLDVHKYYAEEDKIVVEVIYLDEERKQ